MRKVGLLLLLAYGVLGHRYAAVWQSDLTLWQHAAEAAPFKPRPQANLGYALLKAHQLVMARRQLWLAQEVCYLPYVPKSDAAIATRMITRNHLVLDYIEARQ